MHFNDTESIKGKSLLHVDPVVCCLANDNQQRWNTFINSSFFYHATQTTATSSTIQIQILMATA